ncbi:ABC transporter ATP-binding protein [Halopseudomonas nanhaiensis]|uniref:ABC transporter ATP-binding protein n=1 Tax=Halopseudomonas nanhaiensis TaxID=2830842 RepID=UPI001CBE8BF1|nr:ABC transporter ATP-binding protein [Halopseudomonas nanhaiensis]
MLHIDQLSCSYGKHVVLRAVSLAPVEGGSLVALLGPNGAGKSTLIRALAGVQPSTGRVALNGEQVGQMSVVDRHRNLAYLPQTLPQASSLVVYELLLGSARLAGMTADESVREIEAVSARLDITPLLLRQLAQLSGGQRQMVGLAQTLVRRALLLLLDEPTSALDLRWQLKVLEVVKEYVEREQRIALFACHDLNLALRFASDVVLLGGEGQCRTGTPADLITPEALQRTYGVQARVERCSQGYPVVLADAALGVDLQADARPEGPGR